MHLKLKPWEDQPDEGPEAPEDQPEEPEDDPHS